MEKVFVYVRTHNKKHAFSIKVDSQSTVRELLLLTKIELMREEYVLNVEECVIHHVMTRRGRNFFQYAVWEHDLLVKELLCRNQQYFCDKVLYIEVIERYSVPGAKFYKDSNEKTSAIARLVPDRQFSRPEFEVACELGQMYPMPLLVPHELNKKAYNSYLDSVGADFVINIGKLDKVTPVALENDKGVNSDLHYCEVIMRVPHFIMIMMFPLLFVLQKAIGLIMYLYSLIGLTAPYFDKSQVKRHRSQPVCAFRFPLHPGLITTFTQSLLAFFLCKILERYFFALRKYSLSRLMVLIPLVLYAAKVVLLGTSYITSFEQFLWYFRSPDQLGNDNFRFHYLFDEAFRADTSEFGKGGYHRSSEAPQLFRIGQKLGADFHPGVFFYVSLFFKSFSPSFKPK